MKARQDKRLFVSEVSVNTKQIKHAEELSIINKVRDLLLYVILEDNTKEATETCRQIVREETGGHPIKGNIYYSVESTDNGMNIEIVRIAHGGGGNPSVRVTGGVVIVTIKTITIKGELSAIHGMTWYSQNENNIKYPFG